VAVRDAWRRSSRDEEVLHNAVTAQRVRPCLTRQRLSKYYDDCVAKPQLGIGATNTRASDDVVSVVPIGVRSGVDVPIGMRSGVDPLLA
jgi:hypothetical protein